MWLGQQALSSGLKYSEASKGTELPNGLNLSEFGQTSRMVVDKFAEQQRQLKSSHLVSPNSHEIDFGLGSEIKINHIAKLGQAQGGQGNQKKLTTSKSQKRRKSASRSPKKQKSKSVSQAAPILLKNQ